MSWTAYRQFASSPEQAHTARIARLIFCCNVQQFRDWRASVFTSGDKGRPEWNGSAQDLAHCQAWLSAIETVLMTGESIPAESRTQLMRELELAKQTLEQAIAR